ncbi:hypothetical protein [Maribacter sp. 2307UL18-2]|uniref:hypothetical protein n=1 Tax=Maribacter sp. 2307UL18-2 TaxID=3386274 RepID=UPI0039BC7D3E
MIMDTHYKKLLILALGLFMGLSGSAQEKVSKKISKTYNMTNAGKLRIESKYGHINLNGWDRNEVAIEAVITVNHRKKENAEELLRRINPTFKDANDFVSIGYEIAEKSDNWFTNFFEKANPFDYDRSNIQIDYTIHLPNKAELNITNTFGDVILEDWAGKLRALVEHGDVWINQDINKADVTMRYGKLRAKRIGYGTLDLRNGSLSMDAGTSIRINSSGTDMEMGPINSLELYSNKDEINLEQVGTIYGTLRFTTLELERLETSVDLDMKIADFRVSEILGDDTDIAIVQESSEVSLNISGFSHEFEATLEQGLVRLPKSYENIDSKMLDKGKKLREISASYGKTLQGKVSITGKKGVVLLKEL